MPLSRRATCTIALSHKAEHLLERLVTAADRSTNNDGWCDVYIDNAKPDDMTPRQFAWHLSSLSRAGFYKPIDNYAWGQVNVEAALVR